MVAGGDVHRPGKETNGGQEFHRVGGVAPHDDPFLLGKLPGLQKNAVWNAHLPHVVEQRSVAHVAQRGTLNAHAGGQTHGHFRHPVGMPPRLQIAELQRPSPPPNSFLIGPGKLVVGLFEQRLGSLFLQHSLTQGIPGLPFPTDHPPGKEKKSPHKQIEGQDAKTLDLSPVEISLEHALLRHAHHHPEVSVGGDDPVREDPSHRVRGPHAGEHPLPDRLQRPEGVAGRHGGAEGSLSALHEPREHIARRPQQEQTPPATQTNLTVEVGKVKGVHGGQHHASEGVVLPEDVYYGYRLAAQSWSRPNSYGVHLNPNKAAAVTLGAGDSVIVLAQDEH